MTAKPPSLKVRYVSADSLLRNPRNARTHSDQQVREIVRSIQEFGWTNPILVDDGSKIIAGHGRLAAAQSMGMAKVPVIEIGHLSEVQKQALMLADNQIPANAGWDHALLQEELATLSSGGVNMADFGFAEGDDAPLAEPRAKGPKKKTTLFVTVPTKMAKKAKIAIARALDVANIEHNL